MESWWILKGFSRFLLKRFARDSKRTRFRKDAQGKGFPKDSKGILEGFPWHSWWIPEGFWRDSWKLFKAPSEIPDGFLIVFQGIPEEILRGSIPTGFLTRFYNIPNRKPFQEIPKGMMRQLRPHNTSLMMSFSLVSVTRSGLHIHTTGLYSANC